MNNNFNLVRATEGQLMGELEFLKHLPVEQLISRVTIYINWLETEKAKDKISEISVANDKLKKSGDLLAALYAVRADEDHKGDLSDYFKKHPEKEAEINKLIKESGLDVFDAPADALEIKAEQGRDWAIEQVLQKTDRETLAQAFEGKAFKDIKGKDDSEKLQNLQKEVRSKLQDNYLKGPAGQWDKILHHDDKNGVSVIKLVHGGNAYDFHGAGLTVYMNMNSAFNQFKQDNGITFFPAKITGRIHSGITVGSLEENIKKTEGATQSQQSNIDMKMKELDRISSDMNTANNLGSTASKQMLDAMRDALRF